MSSFIPNSKIGDADIAALLNMAFLHSNDRSYFEESSLLIKYFINNTSIAFDREGHLNHLCGLKI